MSAVVDEIAKVCSYLVEDLAKIRKPDLEAEPAAAGGISSEAIHAKTVETLAIGEVLDDLLLADPFLVASEAAAYAVLARAGEDPVDAFVAAQSLLPRSSSIFLRGMAAGMAFLRSAQLLHARGENDTRPCPSTKRERAGRKR